MLKINKATTAKKIAVVLTSIMMLGICMCLSMNTVHAAGNTYTEGTLYYTIDNGSITITGYFGKDATVTVPASIAGIPVNTIAEGAFAGTKATKVKLPGSVITVQQGAFSAGTNVVSNYDSDNPSHHEAGDGNDSGGGGANYSDLDKGDTVIIGKKKLKVTKKKNKTIYLEDSDGRTYHSNGSYIIDDETNEQLEGDVTVIRSDGTQEEYADVTLDDVEDEDRAHSVLPYVIGGLVVCAVIVYVVIRLRRKDS